MLNIFLLPTPDPAVPQSDALGLEGASHELTVEEVDDLRHLLEQHVRVSEALVEYAIEIAGRPGTN